MKKVGIVSCYFKDNYGSMLQAYATKKILDNNNIPNETISIRRNKDFKKGKIKYYITQLFNFSFIKTKFGMIKFKLDKILNKNLKKNIAIRTKKYKEFRKEFNMSESTTTYKELTYLCQKKYSDVIVGSDQLWLPVNVVADYYTLNWVPDNINKISYATSFGVSKIPQKYNKKYKSFLQRINHLSVREDTGIRLTKEIANKDAELVCDPTILLTREEWEEVATPGRIIKDKYILCYFLGKNIEHRKFAERLKQETGYKIVSLNHADEYVKYSDIYADIIPYDIGPKEWINLIKNAEYVCTDSFHGTVFSILFNKIFFNFRRYNPKNKNNTNSRLDSLLNIAGISNERILTGTEKVDKVLNYTINYKNVNKNIDKFREKSKKWLLDSITYKETSSSDKFISIDDKELCCGCSACFSICPQNAIKMERDEEGFQYPKIDKDKCINCGLCKKVCPILNKHKINNHQQKGYIFQYQNTEIRKESTSGGVYTALAEYVLNNNGVVYGVALEKFYVKNIRVTNKKDLYKFRNSKYVQSDKNNTFKQVKEDLINGKKVLYSGTVCEIEGLKSYLMKEYNNLITVDVICRAVPSPLLWKKYVEHINKGKKATKAYFRKKIFGYKYSNLTFENDKEIIYKNGIETDSYLRAFFSNIASRPSCYECHFKKQNHISDLTIWDCFDVEKYDKKFDDDMGTTKVMVNTEKGNKIFDAIKTNHKYKEVEIKDLVNNFHQMFNSIKYNPKRNTFFKDLNKEDFEIVINKYFPNTIKCKIEKYMRIFLIKINLYKPLLNLGKKIRKRD